MGRILSGFISLVKVRVCMYIMIDDTHCIFDRAFLLPRGPPIVWFNVDYRIRYLDPTITDLGKYLN